MDGQRTKTITESLRELKEILDEDAIFDGTMGGRTENPNPTISSLEREHDLINDGPIAQRAFKHLHRSLIDLDVMEYRQLAREIKKPHSSRDHAAIDRIGPSLESLTHLCSEYRSSEFSLPEASRTITELEGMVENVKETIPNLFDEYHSSYRRVTPTDRFTRYWLKSDAERVLSLGEIITRYDLRCRFKGWKIRKAKQFVSEAGIAEEREIQEATREAASAKKGYIALIDAAKSGKHSASSIWELKQDHDKHLEPAYARNLRLPYLFGIYTEAEEWRLSALQTIQSTLVSEAEKAKDMVISLVKENLKEITDPSMVEQAIKSYRLVSSKRWESCDLIKASGHLDILERMYEEIKRVGNIDTMIHKATKIKERFSALESMKQEKDSITLELAQGIDETLVKRISDLWDKAREEPQGMNTDLTKAYLQMKKEVDSGFSRIYPVARNRIRVLLEDAKAGGTTLSYPMNLAELLGDQGKEVLMEGRAYIMAANEQHRYLALAEEHKEALKSMEEKVLEQRLALENLNSIEKRMKASVAWTQEQLRNELKGKPTYTLTEYLSEGVQPYGHLARTLHNAVIREKPWMERLSDLALATKTMDALWDGGDIAYVERLAEGLGIEAREGQLSGILIGEKRKEVYQNVMDSLQDCITRSRQAL